MNRNAVLKQFRDAIATVKRFGVRITRESDWGVEQNGDWHSEERHVCACGALVLACNPKLLPQQKRWSDEAVIAGVMAVLKCTESAAWAISEGFEGDELGDQGTGGVNRATKSQDRPWYAIGKALRRHAEKRESVFI